MTIALNSEKISKIVEMFDSETSKLQPVNPSETSTDTAGAHQRAADSLQNLFLILLQPDPSRVMNDRLIMRCSIQDILTCMQMRK